MHYSAFVFTILIDETLLQLIVHFCFFLDNFLGTIIYEKQKNLFIQSN